jgi:hypothetical protein
VFNQITIHRGLTGNRFDLGLLAESLLFYDDILLLLDRGSLQSMLENLDPETILRLIDEFKLKLSYHREMFATLTRTINGISVNNFTDILVGGRPERKIRNYREEIEDIVVRVYGRSQNTQRFTKALLERISNHKLSDIDKRNLIESTRGDIRDPSYAKFCLLAAASTLAPTASFGPNWRFGFVDLGADGFAIDTNVDFQYIDAEYKKITGQEEGGFTPALVATYAFGVRADCYFASAYMSGYVCDSTSSMLMKRKFTDLIRRRERDAAEIDLFQEKVLPEGRRVREVINSGEAPFDAIFPILYKGRKFKGWLETRNPDQSLIAEYFDEIAKTSWLETLPVKAFRWVTTGGLAIAASAAFSPVEGALAGLGIGAIDMFLIDRLLRGWRPDQFVDATLAQFVAGKNRR